MFFLEKQELLVNYKRDWKGFQCLTVILDTFWDFLRRLGLFHTFGDVLKLLGLFWDFWENCTMTLKVTLSKVPRRTTPTTIFKLVGPCEILSRSKTFATFDLRTCVEMIVQNSNSYKILYANLCYLNTLVRTTLEFT